MIKKIYVFFILSMILFENIVWADDILEEAEHDLIDTSMITTEEPEIQSKHVIVMDRNTETILYEKDAYTKTAMASTTKILTAIVALENGDLNERIIISKKAAGTGGSTLGITSNIEMTLEDLLYGLLLRSGNDCAVAIAEYIGGDLEGFSKLMNEKALEIGLTNSNFVTPHGLDNENHYTTAYDMAILTKYALENEIFCNIVNTKSIDIMIGNYSRHINNTHELLGYLDGVYGVKTGFTGNAGRCLVTAVKRNDLDIIIVVLGADTKKIRTLDTKKLIDYVYNNFVLVDTYEILNKNLNKEYIKKSIKLIKSANDFEVELENREGYRFPINKNEINKIRTNVYHLVIIEAPAYNGTKIGEVRVLVGNKILYSLDIKLVDNIYKKNYKNYFFEFIYDIKHCFY